MVREDVRCDVCTGLLLWTDDDIGYKCITMRQDTANHETSITRARGIARLEDRA